jgi:alpha-ketoglutarate-dependent taurine dioxygenase
MGVQENIRVQGATLALRRVTGRIGAEIEGVSLSHPLSADTIAAIRRALLQHKVIFFRDQHQLSFAAQEAFGKRFGKLIPHPTLPKEAGTEAALTVDYADGTTAANEWHTDDPCLIAYPAIGILHAVTLPAVGGDTLWANTASAYEHLPEPLRVLADTLWVLHSNTFDYEEAAKNRAEQGAGSTVFQAEHPLVRVHPETGERTLVLGYHAQKFLGLNRADSARLIGLYQDHITRPENTVRWHWALGDVALWDNAATQHYGIGDFSEKRVLHRSSIEGEIPVSIDGRRSVRRRGG